MSSLVMFDWDEVNLMRAGIGALAVLTFVSVITQPTPEPAPVSQPTTQAGPVLVVQAAPAPVPQLPPAEARKPMKPKERARARAR